MEKQKTAVVVPAYNEPGIASTLHALYNQDGPHANIEHIVVDNGSTDNTRQVIEEFSRQHPEFPLRIIEESEKGTGSACDTGFRYAIERGCKLIARTDADALPRRDWLEKITDPLARHAHLGVVGGVVLARKDDGWHRRGDDMLMRVAVPAARVVRALLAADSAYLRVAVGSNMATKSDTYEASGGFPRSAIDSKDEDIEYSLKVQREFGRLAIDLTQEAIVDASMRRIRQQGLLGSVLHYAFPSMRVEGSVDIR